MKKLKEFTVSVYGQGRLLGIVCADGYKAFPKSTWYDYSDQIRKAVEMEYKIATSGHMRPQDVPSVRRAMNNQKSPQATDVSLHFSRSGGIDRAKLIAGKRTRMFSVDERTAKTVDAYLNTSRQIVRAIGQLV